MTPQRKQSVEDKYGPVVLECVSKSDPDREPYRVRLKGSCYSCNCKGWIFNKETPRRCLHTDRARMFGPELDGPIELTDTSPAPSPVQVVKQAIAKQNGLVNLLLECLPTSLRSPEMGRKFEAILLAHVPAARPPEQPMIRRGVRRIVFD